MNVKVRVNITYRAIVFLSWRHVSILCRFEESVWHAEDAQEPFPALGSAALQSGAPGEHIDSQATQRPATTKQASHLQTRRQEMDRGEHTTQRRELDAKWRRLKMAS